MPAAVLLANATYKDGNLIFSLLEIIERSSLVIDPWLHDPMPDYD